MRYFKILKQKNTDLTTVKHDKISNHSMFDRVEDVVHKVIFSISLLVNQTMQKTTKPHFFYILQIPVRIPLVSIQNICVY